MRKKIFATAGYTTTFMGPGRKEFDPKKGFKPFEDYLVECAQGVAEQLIYPEFDEGVIASFMSSRFLNQGHLAAFLPMMTRSLLQKPCFAVEGACASGSKAITTAMRSILSDFSNRVFVAGFEMQNRVKSVYGADVLAGAAYYDKERKGGQASFFSGIFAKRAGAYYEKFGYDMTRQALAHWYVQMIENSRKNPKAQEYHNQTKDLLSLGLLPPDPERFIPCLNHYDCSKISDGAAGIVLLSERGKELCGSKKMACVEIVGVGEVQGDITQEPEDQTVLSHTKAAVDKALAMAGIKKEDLAILEIHDCFSINSILAFEAIGFAPHGKGGDFILEGHAAPGGLIPTNLSGGLSGFGHPTGATGVRQMVDLFEQLTEKAPNQAKLKSPYGMMVNMGGNDKTVTAIVVKG